MQRILKFSTDNQKGKFTMQIIIFVFTSSLIIHKSRKENS